jgi:hypothetical protein
MGFEPIFSGEVIMASTVQPRIRAIRPLKLSPAELKEAQEQVLEDTLALARKKFASVTKEEQAAIAARIAAIEVR